MDKILPSLIDLVPEALASFKKINELGPKADVLLQRFTDIAPKAELVLDNINKLAPELTTNTQTVLRDIKTLKPLIEASVKSMLAIVFLSIIAAGVLAATKAASIKEKDKESENSTMQIGYSISSALLFLGIIISLVLVGKALRHFSHVAPPTTTTSMPNLTR